jgi:hypothetical protein
MMIVVLPLLGKKFLRESLVELGHRAVHPLLMMKMMMP